MPSLLTLVVVAVAALVLLASAVRVVPRGRVAVLVRVAGPARLRHPGVVLVVPGLDHLRVVGLQPVRTGPLLVPATTRDGVDVVLSASVRWRVTNPERVGLADPDETTATVDAVQSGLVELVSRTDLRRLLDRREEVLFTLVDLANAETRSWGVEVLAVTAVETDLRVGPELLRMMR